MTPVNQAALKTFTTTTKANPRAIVRDSDPSAGNVTDLVIKTRSSRRGTRRVGKECSSGGERSVFVSLRPLRVTVALC